MKFALENYPGSKRPRPIRADPVQGLGPGRYDGSETSGGVLPKSSAMEDRRRRRIGPRPCDDIVGAARL